MSSGPESGKREARAAYGRLVLVSMLLIAAWLLWSGLYKPLLLALGAFSCALTVIITRRMGFFDTDVFAFRYNLKLLGFWAWLGREIVTSSWYVARIVLAPKLRIDPKVVELDASDLDPVDQALLGNSITLTPGTLTLDVHEGRMLVHALTTESAAAVLDGEMKRRVAALHRD
jgi:multicomponent Na+:H+ antiporter subunit E